VDVILREIYNIYSHSVLQILPLSVGVQEQEISNCPVFPYKFPTPLQIWEEGQIYFHNYIQTIFAFISVLTLALRYKSISQSMKSVQNTNIVFVASLSVIEFFTEVHL
jgi:hypothetical protein